MTTVNLENVPKPKSRVEPTAFTKVKMFGLVPTQMMVPVDDLEPSKARVRSAIAYFSRHKCLPSTITDGTGVFDVQGVCGLCNAVVMRKRVGKDPEPVPEVVECSRCRKMRESKAAEQPATVDHPVPVAEEVLDISGGAAFWTPGDRKVAGRGIRDVVPNMDDLSIQM